MATVTANTTFIGSETEFGNTVLVVNATDTVKKLPIKLLTAKSVSSIGSETEFGNTVLVVNATDTVKKLPIKIVVSTATVLDIPATRKFSWS